ncbi:DNA-binding protein [Salininema proteolyticum]|uniref:DNA-binding protein n=1 Tax=Salininema proteolyticum TaxID=1607685 RepID=UPI0036439C08
MERNDEPAGLAARLKRGLHRLGAPASELVAADLSRDAESHGRTRRTPIADLRVRSYSSILGRLTLIVFETGGAGLGVRAEISDGSGTAAIVWMGRGRIAGLETGSRLRVTGRVAEGEDGLRTFYNPEYQLVR